MAPRRGRVLLVHTPNPNASAAWFLSDLSVNVLNDSIDGAGVFEGGFCASEFRVAGVDDGVEEGGKGEGGLKVDIHC